MNSSGLVVRPLKRMLIERGFYEQKQTLKSSEGSGLRVDGCEVIVITTDFWTDQDSGIFM